MYKQRLHVKKKIKKVFKFNQIIFIIQYRNKQRLQCKKKLKKFLNSIKLFLLFSTEISSTEMSSTEISSTEMSSTEYRDVLIPNLFTDGRRQPNHNTTTYCVY